MFLLVIPVGASSTGWSQTYGGTEKDGTLSLVQTSDGGYAMAGYTRSSGAGEDDFWLIKTDEAGNMQWNQTYGGAGSDIATCLIETSDGGYALVGYTGSFGAGSNDFWFVKTDSSGNMQWNRTYGGADGEYAFSLVETSDGGYTIAGYTLSYGAGRDDFWLIKVDSSGNAEWNQTYGGVAYDVAYSVVQADDGGYALAGSTQSFGAGVSDAWLIKTDEAGVIPEFPSWTILPLLLTATLLAIICKKRLPKTQKNNHIRRIITEVCLKETPEKPISTNLGEKLRICVSGFLFEQWRYHPLPRNPSFFKFLN